MIPSLYSLPLLGGPLYLIKNYLLRTVPPPMAQVPPHWLDVRYAAVIETLMEEYLLLSCTWLSNRCSFHYERG